MAAIDRAEIDWADFELIERIAELGTLSAAARALGVDQTTVSRRLQRAEDRLGGRLFDRIEGRLVRTPLLERTLPHLAAMAELAGVARAALAHSRAELDGRVRVTSVAFVLTRVLAPAFGLLQAAHPRLSVDLVGDDRAARFERRETDIAVRLARPTDDIALARRIGEIGLTLARIGPAAAGAAAPLFCYDDALGHLPEMRALARHRPGAAVALRCNRLDVLIEAGLAAGGEMMVPDIMLDRDPRLATALRSGVHAVREVWLLVHPDRRRTPSVAAVVDWIDQAFGDFRSA